MTILSNNHAAMAAMALLFDNIFKHVGGQHEPPCGH
jgi:hypothetical protein